MSVSAWIIAARPRTLTLSMTPVLLGAALAWASSREIHLPAVLAALVGSMLIQIGTNLHNDVADSELGGDGPDRVGPARATASGLLTAHSVKRAAYAAFAAAAALGVYLIMVGGWPILVLGLLSIFSGWAYTGGPVPIAYTPLGELFVLAFFGVGAVCGTYWLCTGQLDAAALTGGVALGLLAGAVLLVNNHRDVEADTRVGRRTLAIVVGGKVTAWIYTILMLMPFALLPILGSALPRGRTWLAFVALPFAMVLIYHFFRLPQGRAFNRILVRTVQTQLLFSLFLVIGLLW